MSWMKFPSRISELQLHTRARAITKPQSSTSLLPPFSVIIILFWISDERRVTFKLGRKAGGNARPPAHAERLPAFPPAKTKSRPKRKMRARRKMKWKKEGGPHPRGSELDVLMQTSRARKKPTKNPLTIPSFVFLSPSREASITAVAPLMSCAGSHIYLCWKQREERTRSGSGWKQLTALMSWFNTMAVFRGEKVKTRA